MAWRPSWTSALIRLLLIALCLSPIAVAHGDDGSDRPDGANSTVHSHHTSDITGTTSDDPSATRVVDIFYIDERAYEGLPYTLFHRDSGSVVGVTGDVTTFVITTTRGDRRPRPTHSRTDNVTTGIPTLTSSPPKPNWTGEPSIITQGPGTFEFTGARFGGANHTVVNRCSLNGTAGAACNLTHVGSIWYASDPDWNGTFSTYSYNWTSGDRFGFAPVTITAGVDKMGPPSSPSTVPASTNAAAVAWSRPRSPGRGAAAAGGAAWWVPGRAWLEYGMGALFPAFVLVLAVAL